MHYWLCAMIAHRRKHVTRANFQFVRFNRDTVPACHGRPIGARRQVQFRPPGSTGQAREVRARKRKNCPVGLRTGPLAPRVPPFTAPSWQPGVVHIERTPPAQAAGTACNFETPGVLDRRGGSGRKKRIALTAHIEGINAFEALTNRPCERYFYRNDHDVAMAADPLFAAKRIAILPCGPLERKVLRIGDVLDTASRS